MMKIELSLFHLEKQLFLSTNTCPDIVFAVDIALAVDTPFAVSYSSQYLNNFGKTGNS